MKRLVKTIMLLGAILSFLLMIYSSCKKEFSCENCLDISKPPIANAGIDTVIFSPVDSVVLDGRNSTDPDDGISGYSWRKVSGSDSLIIRESQAASTVAAKMTKGKYSFELTVTDKGGLSAKDTVEITVRSQIVSNRPPIADAGMDTTLILPVNNAGLDGSRSKDPDNNIASYAWRKVSGPASYLIVNYGSVSTEVKDLKEGMYLFELIVADSGGLFSMDTVEINISLAKTSNCDISDRKLINARLTQIGSLSEAREDVVVAAAGNKILFASGYTTGPKASSRVDIFDVSNGSWTTAELSQARAGIAAAVSGNKIYFAGGHFPQQGSSKYSSRVDIYDASTNTWSIKELSTSRTNISAVASGGRIFFAGGFGDDIYTLDSDAPIVDIFNEFSNTWTIDHLRERVTTGILPDFGIAATAIGDRVYFAGNASDWLLWDFGSITSKINAYDISADKWNTSELTMTRGFMGSIAVGDHNYWAGGVYKQPHDTYTDLVEIRNMSTDASTLTCLFQPNAFFKVVRKQQDLVFFTAGWDIASYQTNIKTVYNKFDIYNIASGTWSIGVLPLYIYGSAIVSNNDIIYVAGGYVNGVLSNKVSKLEF